MVKTYTLEKFQLGTDPPLKNCPDANNQGTPGFWSHGQLVRLKTWAICVPCTNFFPDFHLIFLHAQMYGWCILPFGYLENLTQGYSISWTDCNCDPNKLDTCSVRPGPGFSPKPGPGRAHQKPGPGTGPKKSLNFPVKTVKIPNFQLRFER